MSETAKQQKMDRTRTQSLVFMSLLASLLPLIIAALFLVTQTPNRMAASAIGLPDSSVVEVDIATSLGALITRVTSLEERIHSLSQLPTRVAMGARLAEVSDELTNLSSRLRAIERVIVQSPGEVLELNLLIREIELLKSSMHVNQDGTREEIDRIYSLGQWLIGLIFTIALGLFGLSISHFFKRTSKLGNVSS